MSHRHSRFFKFIHTSVFVLLAAAGMNVVSAQSAQCPQQPAEQPLSPALRKTVVITDPAAMNGFSFTRTLNAIIESSPGHTGSATEAERIGLLQSLIATFKETKFLNRDSGVTLGVKARPGEAALSPIKLLNPTNADGMRPIGLFNRLDLAPADFRNCGQHRIVYGKGAPVSETNRFFLIFEAALDNPVDDPDIEKRKAACRNIAVFWDSLKSKSGSDLASDLETFYYSGLTPATPGAPVFKPVVQFAHFGTPDGQVRGNLFVTTGELFLWELREWRLVASENARPLFAAVTVKDNPIAGLYGARKVSDPFDQLRDPFKTNFVDRNEPGFEKFGTFLQQLTNYDLKVIRTGSVDDRRDELSASVAMSVQNKFNDFQSVEGPPTPDTPKTIARQGDLVPRITAKLSDAAACNINPEHVLNRAGANSCAGCHEFSQGAPIAPGVLWPASLGFVHISEKSELSPALEKEFLPARRRRLDRALAEPVAAAPTPAPGPVATINPTLGGQLTSIAAVRNTLQTLQASTGSRIEFLENAVKLEKQVIESRAEERAQPGAFIDIRREH